MYGRAVVEYLKRMEQFLAMTPKQRARSLKLPR